jgi:two-component system response regulator HydG
LFKTYEWPGNLRELKNVIKRAALLTETETVELTALPFELVNHSKLVFDRSGHYDAGEQNNNGENSRAFQKPAEINEHSLRSVSIDAEYETIVMALKKANYNKSKAAKILNVDRKTLYNKMRQYKEFNEG